MEEQGLSMNKPVTEIEHGHTEYSDEELLELSQLNAQALLMASAKTAREDRDAWCQRIAESFAGSWDTKREWDAVELLDSLLTNYRSFGATILEHDLTASPPTALIADLPDVELMESLDARDEDADSIFVIGEHLARLLNLSLEWTRDTETGDVRISVS